MKIRHSLSAFFLIVLAFAIAAPVAAQDWRGVGRLGGVITDDTGKPIEGAVVKAQLIGSTGTTEAKTNKKGEWALNGINGGQWNLDFQKDGYETSRITATVQTSNFRFKIIHFSRPKSLGAS